jgi:hypothetical protein
MEPRPSEDAMRDMCPRIAEYVKINTVTHKIHPNGVVSFYLTFPDGKKREFGTVNYTWDGIKQHLDRRIINAANIHCDHCNQDLNIQIACAMCAKSICVRCYLYMMDDTRGVHKCPYCTFTVGEPWPAEEHNARIRDMLDRYTGKVGDTHAKSS